MADGIAGVGIMNVLLDANPEAPRLPKKKLKFHVPPPRDPLASLTAGFVESYSDFVKRILSAMADLLSMAERAAANGSERGHRRVCQACSRKSQRLPSGSVSTSFTKDRRNSLSPRFRSADSQSHSAGMRHQRERRHSRHRDRHHSTLLRAAWRPGEGKAAAHHGARQSARQMAARRNWATAFRSSPSPFRWISGHRSSCWPLSINEPNFSNACMPPSW